MCSVQILVLESSCSVKWPAETGQNPGQIPEKSVKYE